MRPIAGRYQAADAMELRHLRYFQAIAEELSFSKASRRLHIVQPALSRAVKELEEELGLMLFDRNRREVRLTPAGSVLRVETALLIERFEQAIRRVKRTAAGEEGELRLGYIGPPTQSFLGRLLDAYRKQCPQVTVLLEERTPERVWEMVVKGRLSVGLTRPVLGTDVSTLRTVLLREERLCLAVPAGHPWAKRRSLSWSQLAGQPLIVLARREGAGLHDEIMAACRKAGFLPRLIHTPSLIGSVLRYVEGGVGLGIVPDSLATSSEKGQWAMIPLAPSFTVPLVMAWREDNDPAVTAFTTLVGDWVKGGKLFPRD